MPYTGRNPWDVLGVAEGAPFSDVKRAYLRGARLTHPDAPGGSAEAFREVQAAFEALSRRATRASQASQASQAWRVERPTPTPYDRWTGRPSRQSKQWSDDDDPLVGAYCTPADARRPTFAQVLSAELGRRWRAA